VEARTSEIERRGYSAQVPQVAGLSLVFSADDRGKQRVRVADAATVARSAAVGALGPNVLLRPVVERALLPTVAYVAGPGEIGYFAQVSAVADSLGGSRPLAVPRWSGTVVEPHIDRLLHRYDLTIEDLRDPHAAEGRLARQRLPDDIVSALDRFRARTATDVEALAVAAAGIVGDRVFAGLRAALAQRTDRLERRLIAAVKSREAIAMRDLATARAALHPAGGRQERSLNLLPLLARHGPELLDRVQASIRPAMTAMAIGAGSAATPAASSAAHG
jgi:uncharacterized protein YllA (UPF0747 family)